MKLEISVPEIVSFFKKIQGQSIRIGEMIRSERVENIGKYLFGLIENEHAKFLGQHIETNLPVPPSR